MASSSLMPLAGAAKHHPAGIDDDDVVGEVERQLDILLDQHDRLPFGLELRDGASDLGHQLRREPLGRLVHQQHAGVAHERAPDREHLLLAAGERAGDLGVALGEPGKDLEHAVDRPARAVVLLLRLRRHHQVLAHRERAEHAPALRDQADALARDHVGRETGDGFAVQADRAAPRLEKAHDGRHAGGLAGAVASEQAEQPARLQRERHAVQHVAVAVIGVEVGDRERFSRQDTPPGCADRRPPRRACLRR